MRLKNQQNQVQRKTSNQLPQAYAPNQGDDGENDETLRPGQTYFYFT